MRSVRLWLGDCRKVLERLPDGSVDAFITDPPYDLVAANSKGGFMGKSWDATGIAFDQVFWEIVYRKLKVGGVVKSFGATRTYHRKVRAMRKAGLQVQVLHGYVYGVGFPKSTNISKRIDRMFKAERKVVGVKRGVGGENMNDIVRGKTVRNTKEKGARGVGAYGTGAKQVAVDVPITVPATKEANLWDGYGTMLKPAWECIIIGVRG